MTCPRSHRKSLAELGIEPRFPSLWFNHKTIFPQIEPGSAGAGENEKVGKFIEHQFSLGERLRQRGRRIILFIQSKFNQPLIKLMMLLIFTQKQLLLQTLLYWSHHGLKDNSLILFQVLFLWNSIKHTNEK